MTTTWTPGDPVHRGGTHYPRSLVEVLDDHCTQNDRTCSICPYNHADMGGTMRWSPKFPIGVEQGPVPISGDEWGRVEPF